MFVSHEHSGFNYIELYTLLQQTLPSQQYQVIDQSEPAFVYLDEAEDIDADEAEPEVDVVDDEEEKSEIQVSHFFNTNTEDVDNQALLSLSHVYCPLQHMTNLNLDDDEPSSDIFYNSYIRPEGELKVGDHFLNKEDYV